MKIHEYNEMMAYLTRPSYVSGGRVGFQRGSGNPVPINASTLAKFDDLIKNTDLTLKEIGRKFGYAADLRSNSYLVKAYEDAFGKIPEARFKPYTMIGTEKAKQILSLYDQQLATLPEANFSAIAREVLGKDDADTRKIVRSLVKRERGLKRTPIPKYEGPLTATQRMSKSRKTKLTPVTNRELEKIIRGTGGFDLHHMDSKRWNVTMGNLAYVDSKLNQKELMKADTLLEKLYKQRDNLSPNDFEGHNLINEKGRGIVKNKNLKGLVNFKVYDPKTKKFSDFGMDLSKAIIPEGQLEELRNVPLKELTKDQKAKVVEVAQKVRAGLAKGEPGILKKGISMLGKGLGRIVMGAIGPTGIVGTTAGFGVDPKSAVDRMGIEAEAALAPELVRSTIGATKGMKNRGAQKVVQQLLNLGMPTQMALRVARVAQPLGLLALGGEGLYKMYKEGHFEKERMMPSLMDKEAYAGAQQEQFDVNQPMFNQGGRVGFAKGPKDPGRRLFLKGIGMASLIPIVGKYFKFAEPATKAAAAYTGPVLEGLGNKLQWVQLLAKRLWTEGDDVTKTAGTAERQIVKRGTLESGDEVDMIYDVNTKDVRFEVTPKSDPKKHSFELDTKSGAYNKEYGIDYKAPQVIDEGVDAGKKTKAEVDIVENRHVGGPEDVDFEIDFLGDDVEGAMSDLTELEAFAKKKTVKQIHKKKGTKPKDVFPDYDWDDVIDPSDYD